MKIKAMKPLENNLSGSEIINRLRKGHVVRRACWIDGYFIRITNEPGFDEDGNAAFDERHNTIYTICTNGYFLHLGYSSQPFRDPKVWRYHNTYQYNSRDGEGLGMLFADDWEDYGFMSGASFDILRKNIKDTVRARKKELIAKAIAEAEQGDRNES